MIYFTADIHFGHKNIIRFCDRPYADVLEMNEDLIARWNAKVNQKDNVYILGDMFYRIADPVPILERLHGKKHLILGNHDSFWTRKTDLDRYFSSVQGYMEVDTGQALCVLSHYPMLSWNHQRHAYMIHGHIHNDTTMDYWTCILARDRLLNAGVDINRFEPVALKELIENNSRFKSAHNVTGV